MVDGGPSLSVVERESGGNTEYLLYNMKLSSVVFVQTDKPDIDKSPKLAKAASNKGETGKLICRAKGAPKVTFAWNRKDGVSINSTSSKYSIRTRLVSPRK
jgi:hypothetical protein